MRGSSGRVQGRQCQPGDVTTSSTEVSKPTSSPPVALRQYKTMYAVVCLCALFTLAVVGDRIVFPDNEENTCGDCQMKIPLELALRLNTITDENQLFREFIRSPDDVEAPIIKAVQRPVGFGPDSVSVRLAVAEEDPIERKAVLKPRPSGCIPEMRSVSLRLTEDPLTYYWPPCTRVEQCGGCCNHHLLACQATEVETLNFEVTVTEYVNNRLQYKGKEIVPIDKHIKCKCDCRTKQEHCTPLQEYRKGECRCVCTNKDAEAKCNAEGQRHWNAENCSCECLEVVDCPTETFFSQSSCSCEPIPDETTLKRFGITSSDNLTVGTPLRRRWPGYVMG